jgi:hypothetical protein
MQVELTDVIAALSNRIVELSTVAGAKIEMPAYLAPQPASTSAPAAHPKGQHIVVLDRGFVYVGDVSCDDHYVTITNARNIRKWGTTEGLGELRNGPLADTKLDKVGEVIAPHRAVIHFIPCKGF